MQFSQAEMPEGLRKIRDRGYGQAYGQVTVRRYI